MATRKIFTLVILTIFLRSVLALPKQQNSIFLRGSIKNYCQLKCGVEDHTLCKKSDVIPKKCGNSYYEYGFKTNNFRNVMLDGHNGIRNKIAKIVPVSNMRIMTWDDELATMARYWLSKCVPYKKDPCTQLDRVEGDREKSYTLVNQNIITKINKFYPIQFRPSTIRTWYLEKNNITKYTMKDKYFGYFGIQNNFTQLISAGTTRVGCAMVRYNDYVYQIACNYHAFNEKDASFRKGRSASYCPNRYPIRSLEYENLCTDRAGLKTIRIFIVLMLFVCVIVV